jgi:ribonuclease J
MSLRFIALSGTTEVTENAYVYEYLSNDGQVSDMVLVDCGLGFSDSEISGVDLVIPDFDYVKSNLDKLRGVVITHGHEDHLGALPFFLKEVETPVYATKLVAGFIESRLNDYGVRNRKINVIDPDKDVLSLGSFRFTPFRLSHSVPDSVGFAIDTPEGRIFHVSDYKFDWTPVSGHSFDIRKAASMASAGVLAVISDCLGSTTPGYTLSEMEVGKKIEEIVADARGRVFFTTISSNISRIQQALNVASNLGRRACFVGRSIETKSKISERLGYLKIKKGLLIDAKKASRLPDNKAMYIISGSYGQPGSNLYRLSMGEHRFLHVKSSDVVIFSSDPAPPGTEEAVNFVVDRLTELKAEVHYYDLQEDLHVSGHGSQEDIKLLFALLKPKYFIPIGGTIRHMRAYSQLVEKMGFNQESVFELLPGEIVEFKSGTAKRSGKIPVKEVFVDSLQTHGPKSIVIRNRQSLTKDGIALVLIQVDKARNKLVFSPDIIVRGQTLMKKDKESLIHARRGLEVRINNIKRLDKQAIREVSTKFLENFFFKSMKRRPLVVPVVIEI